MVWVAAAIAIAGCSGLGRGDADGPGTIVGGAAPRLQYLAGNRGITVGRGSIQSDTGCPIDTTRFEPRRPRTAVPVILAPGFLRDRRHLSGLARALADQGIPAVTLSQCSRPWDGAPVRNALAMIAVARRLGARQVVYGGFSAGALAALIAGRLDPHTRGALALDLVDQAGLGVGMARALDRPLLGLAGDPAACNAHNNGLKVFAASPGGRVARIRGAGHCDFESPTDWLCRAVCSDGDRGSAARRAAIIAAAVAAVADLVGLARPGADPVPIGFLDPERPSTHGRRFASARGLFLHQAPVPSSGILATNWPGKSSYPQMNTDEHR
ncbi:alpha/beta hydrolase [Candidatus Thiodictyon syntrophicum]|jgi:hypothetical protein|uniref:alpha/beta hydrolase n=1 Tax=Candidatus Thiodictyon syntrophicum TaxID=1166950 RepID=UPI001C129979|nr:alpha/beta hydrolase [Candidatus Thiodictyon syntrophicum]